MAQLLRADLLPEAWIAPPPVRQLRALLRHRVALVRLRTLLRNRIHAVLADHGHDRPAGCWSGPGRAWLASVELSPVSRELVDDDLALIDALQHRIGAGAREGGQDFRDGRFLGGGFGQREAGLDLGAVAAAVFVLDHLAGWGSGR